MTLPRGSIAQLRPTSAYPTLRHVEGGIPPNTPEATAAILRAKQRLAEKTPYNRQPVVVSNRR